MNIIYIYELYDYIMKMNIIIKNKNNNLTKNDK